MMSGVLVIQVQCTYFSQCDQKYLKLIREVCVSAEAHTSQQESDGENTFWTL